MKLRLIILILLVCLAAPALAIDSLAVTDLSLDGVAYSLTAAGDDTSYVPNTGEMFLAIANASGGDLTVTIYSQAATWYTLPTGAAASNQTVTITTGTTKLIGPFNQRSWNNTTGYMIIKLSTTTSVTLKAFKFP